LGISDDIEPPGSVARVTAQALRRIGYRVELTIMTRARYNRMPPTAQNAFDVGPFAWYADFPSPSTFFQTMLVCHAPAMHGRICEPGLDRSIARALAHEAEGRGDAERLWAAIDRRATRLALTVPLVNPRSIELTSPRLSGYEYNPQLGFLPALASVA
jgi:ABC-type oligopeptide transport system substrate-binding subunit